MPESVLLLTKQDRFSAQAQEIAKSAFGDRIMIASGAIADPAPPLLRTASYDLLVSFLSPWIVSKETLNRYGLAINFHPGSADYPGTGCYNFALYDEAAEFGAVCHHMLPKVDTGRIIIERRFPVSPDDSVETLKLATMEIMIGMFQEVIAMLAAGMPLPLADAHWTRRPYTRREMEALKVLRHDMSELEVQRRVRATVYPGYPGPRMHHADGSIYAYPVPERAALA